MVRLQSIVGVALAVATALGSAGPSYAEFRFDDYAPSSISKLIRDYPHDPDTDRTIETAHLKYKVRVSVVGKSMPLEVPVADLLDRWARALRHPPEVRALFAHSVLVREGNDSYWIPIQEPLLPSLEAEVKPDGLADIFIMRIGSIRSGPVFVINEFQAVQPE